jgi:hypothetical protein
LWLGFYGFGGDNTAKSILGGQIQGIRIWERFPYGVYAVCDRSASSGSQL